MRIRIYNPLSPKGEDYENEAFFDILENEKLSTAFLCATRNCAYLCPCNQKKGKQLWQDQSRKLRYFSEKMLGDLKNG